MEGARLMIFGLALVSLACAMSVRGDEPEGRVFFEKKNSEAVDCRVSLHLGYKHTVEWQTRDSKVMKELILDPLANARPDLKPARYEIRGSITITRKDGSEEVFILFDPWGHVKRGNVYLIADLRRLPAALKEALKDAIRSLE
jgi:hypothetical protein